MPAIFAIIYKKIRADFKNSMPYAEPSMIPFGILWLIVHPLFYLINLHVVAPQEYNSIAFRIVMSIMCLVLAMKNYWPQKMQIYLPLIWYSTLVIEMPFFATFMICKNNFSAAWALNSVVILVLMIMFTNWITYCVLLFIGILLGIIIYWMSTPKAFPIVIDLQQLNFFDIVPKPDGAR